MDFLKLTTVSRKVHRFCVLLTVALGLVMLVTGMMMKFGLDGSGSSRQLHNFLSPVFGGVFFIMMLTGLVMYLQPWIFKHKSQ